MQEDDLRLAYTRRYPVLQRVADELERCLRDVLVKVPRVDAITTRIKSEIRFLEKALRLDEHGQRKYADPLREIQDQIGARVVVFYKSDVERVRDCILREFIHMEDQRHEPDSAESFGYEARHLICLLPPEMLDRHKDAGVEVFELQVCTLFEHAWAQAYHDLGYKPQHGRLTTDEKRRSAWAAAQAWGADMIFDELFSKNCSE